MVGWMKKQWIIPIVILLLGSFFTIPAETTRLEGSMVGIYGFGVSESTDSIYPNTVNLTLTGGIDGINHESPYYNCGVTERLMTIKCQGPRQDQEEIRHLNKLLVFSISSDEYRPAYGQWYYFLIALVTTFTINLQNGDNEVTFTIETETDIIDFSTNSSEITSVNESVSFNYVVQTNYTNTLIRDLLPVGIFLTGVAATGIIIIAAAKIIPTKSN